MIGYDNGRESFAKKYLRSIDLKSHEGSGRGKLR